ncbi:hypothetical protein Sta7437_4827 (plasmid) [Stanieria cyanosphaera PCC 7437]|uniref:Uncharacterized protein n=1 Tax=Stanieria cyanosphaera (strain ATCC 29371 / PCC 7437) TaxID=111780 RepID=K9Y0A4_STAC7|nr:hypothetical protein [Stanieria cyanosphaera]AFZ38260.1 hypothetical protein Sta7437_4827 [Stanieria cyanosphaera PCC 7437]
MAFSTENNSRFSKSLVAARLMLGLSASLLFLPMEKALADPPYSNSSLVVLSVSNEECKARAINAANAVLSNVKTPSENSIAFQLLGNTAETSVAIHCIESSDRTVAIVTASSKYESLHGEAKSVVTRITNFLKNGL